jgi:hypothetical protein
MAKTLEQRSNADGWAKPGELIEITGAGASALTVTDRVLLNLLYERISSRIAEDEEHVIPLAELRQMIGGHQSNDQLRDSVRRLKSVVVEVEELDSRGKRQLRFTSLLDEPAVSVEEGDPAAMIRFGITKTMRRILGKSQRWGRIKAEVICEMTSKYAVALYELIQLRRGMERCVETFPIERFRQLMGVPSGKLDRGPDFTRRVLDAAKLEVNALSDMSIDYDVVRKGSRAPISAVILTWWPKRGDEYRSALAERHRPKRGRLARLRGEE